MLRLSVRWISCAVAVLLVSACGGGSGGGNPPPTQPPPTGGTVVVSGRVTFDRIPFEAELKAGLDMDSPIESPARHIVVEGIDATSEAILASTTTDLEGEYALTLPENRTVFLRAKAQMLKDDAPPTWNFRVLDNTSGDALWALDSDDFSTGTADSTRDLHASSGWGGTTYSATRAAAPFAILDTVFQAKELILGAQPTVTFPELDIFWSPDNRPATPVCPDEGNIGTSFYESFSEGGPFDDDCGQPLPNGIYILGDFEQQDTDEFDQHVIAHEFGHYFEDRFARSDSIGGPHTNGNFLDLRLAFGEGWGNAYAAMSLNDPIYRDSFSGVAEDFGFNLEADGAEDPGDVDGWYSEGSVGELLWDIYDPANEATDTVALGFEPIYTVMTGAQVDTPALTSIFSFVDALRAQNAPESGGIDALLANEDIASSDEFAEGETNSGGDEGVLPVYQDILLNAPLPDVCTRAVRGASGLNKLGNRKFLRFSNAAQRLVTIQAQGATTDPNAIAATDPDIFVYLAGAIIAAAQNDTLSGTAETTGQISLPAGDYIIEVYDFDMPSSLDTTPRCMTVSITG